MAGISLVCLSLMSRVTVGGAYRSVRCCGWVLWQAGAVLVRLSVARASTANVRVNAIKCMGHQATKRASLARSLARPNSLVVYWPSSSTSFVDIISLTLYNSGVRGLYTSTPAPVHHNKI